VDALLWPLEALQARLDAYSVCALPCLNQS
jgi:hypothetical protein